MNEEKKELKRDLKKCIKEWKAGTMAPRCQNGRQEDTPKEVGHWAPCVMKFNRPAGTKAPTTGL